MSADHYATLGLAPHAAHSAIRAAYLALMQRYHPDKNHSADAAARAREVTVAYGVLGNRERRSAYDLERAEANAERADQISISPGPKGAKFALFAFVALTFSMLLFLIPSHSKSTRAGGRSQLCLVRKRHPIGKWFLPHAKNPWPSRQWLRLRTQAIRQTCMLQHQPKWRELRSPVCLRRHRPLVLGEHGLRPGRRKQAQHVVIEAVARPPSATPRP